MRPITPLTPALALALFCAPVPMVCAQQEEAREHPLIVAADAGDLEAVRALLDEGADANVQTARRDFTRGWTPLLFAIRKRHVEVVGALLDAGAELRPMYELESFDRTRGEHAAELFAAAYGNREIMELVIDAGGDFTIERKQTDTLLHIAAGNTDAALVAFLIDEVGLDVNSMNEQGQTPLFATCFWQREMPDPLDPDPIPRDLELEAKRLGVMQTLIDRGVSVNRFDSSGRTALMLCAKRGLASMVKLLLDSGAEVKDPGGSVFFQRGVDADQQVATFQPVLVWAVDQGDRGVVTMLAEAGADTNALVFGRDLLALAVVEGNPLVIGELVELGFDVNQRDRDGRSLLMQATLSYTDNSLRRDQHRGHLYVAKALIDAGVDIDAPDNAGRTALHYAAGCGVPEIVQLMLDAGADPLAEDKEGLTPLDFTTPEAPRLVRTRVVADRRALGRGPLERAIEAREAAREAADG